MRNIEEIHVATALKLLDENTRLQPLGEKWA